MSEVIPILSIRRPVENIDQERIDAFARRLHDTAKKEDPAVKLETVQGILRPADKLFTKIIAPFEFERIQRRLGAQSLDQAGVEELKGCLEEALADRPATLSTSTLPIKKRHYGEFPRLRIDIAKSPEIMEERFAAQNVIRDFMGLEGRINSWFGRAQRIVPMGLVSISAQAELKLLDQAAVMLQEGQLMPEETEFGAIDISADAVYSRD